jgi:hypothetical protein
MPLAQSQSPDLKPYRTVNQHEVINGHFTSELGTLNKGTFVTISMASGNPNVNRTGTGLAANTPFIGSLGNWGEAPAYATSLRYGIGGNKVRAANSGEVVLGVTLVDTKETNQYGTNYAYEATYKKNEDQVVLSGESVPILTRGLISTNGYVGTPVANSGAYVSGGLLVPCVYNKTLFPQLVGKFMEGPDPDNFVWFKVEL